MKFICVLLKMLILNHLGTPNSPFPLTPMDVNGSMIYYTDHIYHTDQWLLFNNMFQVRGA